MINAIITYIVDTIDFLGYFGIFILMAIESSIIPLPSEVIMIPAGYLVFLGKMDFTLAVIAGSLGSLLGALVNYYIAIKLGRKFIKRYGKYFFMSEKSLDKTEEFFKKHGHISTFIGRLLPLIRHYISLPAGLAKMSLIVFSIYTTLGALIWVIVLTYFGYWLGGSFEHLSMQEIATSFGGGSKDATQASIKDIMHTIAMVIIGFVILLGIIYTLFQKFKSKK